MRQLILFFAFSFYFNFCFSQGVPFPTYQQFGSQTTLTDFKGALRGVKGIIIGRYADTATANLGSIDFYPGAQIITDSPLDVLWQRNFNATAWLEIGTSITTSVTNIFESLTDCYGLLNPGVVSWSQLLIFDVSPADYIINCNDYTSAQTQLTLDAAHPTLNRIDVIYVDTLGLVGKLTGTPAADPAKPQVDPSSQLELTSILILAGATTPSGVAGNVIYDQNTGAPEWPGTATGVSVSFGNTTNPFHLTIAADVGAFTAGQSFRFVKSSGTESINDYGLLKFYIRLKAAFSNQAMLRLDWMNGATSVSSTVNLSSGQFGFTRTTVGSYQIITIPLSAWNFTSDNVNTLRVTLAGSNASGFYIDWVQLQSGITQNPTVFPNGFGVFQTPSGAAISTQPNDISNFIGAGNISITATGKTVTWNGTSTSSTITIINDSTVQVCTAQGSCQTIVFSDVDAQNVWVINDTTLLVCNVTNTLCDTVDIPNPVFFDRAFFAPNQASLANTDHHFNGFDLYGHGGTFIMDDDGLAIKASSLITPIQAVNNHTDLTTVKTGVFMGREVAGNGAAGLGIQLRTAIDNASSAQVVASDLITQWTTATAGSETAQFIARLVNAGTLQDKFIINGNGSFQAPDYGNGTFTGTETYLIATDVNGNFIEFPAGGLPGGGALITADNGITANTATNVQLGATASGANSPLLHNTFINTGAFTLDINTATASINPLSVTAGTGRAVVATSSGGLATVTVTNSSSGFGIQTTGTTNAGIFTTSTGGSGISAFSTNALAGEFVINPASTNSIGEILRLARTTSGTAANNIGGSIDIYNEADGGTLRLSNQLISKLTVAADATRTSQFIITGVNSAATADLFTLSGTGALQLNKYGIGTFTGTAAKWLAVTSTGLVIEEDAPSGVNIYNGDGTLEEGRTVSTAGFNTTWTGSNAVGATFTVNNTNTSSGTYAIAGVAAANTAAVSGTNTGTGGGLLGTGASGTGVTGVSTTGLGAGFTVNPSSTNTVANIIEITRLSSGSAANGIGGRIQFTVENEAGGTRLAAALDAVFTEITDATRDSKFIINTVLNGATVESLVLFGDGTIKLRPITAAAASAITPAEGMLVFVSDTDATFTTIGIWCYQNAAWKAL